MNKSCFRILNQKTVEEHGGLSGLMRHDRRENIWADQEINEELKKENEYKQARRLDDVKREHEKIIRERTGRGMQKKTMDVREGVVELPDNATIKGLWHIGEIIASTPILRSRNKKIVVNGKSVLVAEPLLDVNGKQVKVPLEIKPFAAFLHRDEGHWIGKDGLSAHLMKGKDGKWYDPAGKEHNPKKEGLIWKRHIHGHLWFDVIDYNTGKTIRPSVEELSQLQTLVALELGMERGEVGSKRKHTSKEIYRLQKIEEEMDKEFKSKHKDAEKHLDTINRQIEERRAINENLRVENEDLSTALDTKRSDLATINSTIDAARESLRSEKEKAAEEFKRWKDAEEERKKIMVQAEAMKAKAEAAEQSKLERLRELDCDIASKEEYLKSLASASLLEEIKKIPDKIKAELQSRVAKYWKGKILSYRETKHKVIYNGNERLLDFVDIKMDYKGDMYVLAIELGKGAVWVNGKLAKNESGNYIYMKEVAEFIGTELTPQAKQLACSLFMKEGEKVIQHKDNKGISI